MRCLVTGGAGFIGSELCKSIWLSGNQLTILDDLSSGSLNNVRTLLDEDRSIRFIKGDCTSPRDVRAALRGVHTVYHLAANPEVRLDRADPSVCFKSNIHATYVLLEQIKNSRAETVVFASSSTVYGEPKLIPTPENYEPLQPISIYGASKLSCEAMIGAYSHTFAKRAIILRLANIIGPDSNHGIITDLLKQATNRSRRLLILGDGRQNKSYLHVSDCVSAIRHATDLSDDMIEVFNVGSEDQIEVSRIARIVAETVGLPDSDLVFGKGTKDGRGWRGDVKNMLLDIRKLRSRGWEPKLNSEEAVRNTLNSLVERNSTSLASSNTA